MKKFAYIALAFVLGVITSCTDKEEVEIIQQHDLTLNISTQAMYDQFGIANDIRNNFLNGGKTIGVTTFVYDSVGVFVSKLQNSSSSMSSVKLDVNKLNGGKYILVTIETLVDESTGKSETWSYDNMEKITELRISQTAIPSYQNVIGVSTQTINLTKDETLTIEPKAIGSMVNYNCYNFEESAFENLGFTTDFALSYYSLDPNLQRKDRFHISTSVNGVLRGKISKGESKTEILKIYLPESEINWECKYQDSNGVEKNIWKSNDNNSGSATLVDGVTYEAGYYYLDSKRFFTTAFFGDSKEKISFIAENSEMSSYIHVEPYVDWENGTVKEVKSYMSSYAPGNDGKLIEKSGEYVLWYYGKYREDEIDYWFSSTVDGLSDAVIFFDSRVVGEDFLVKALSILKYSYLFDLGDEESGPIDCYVSEDENTALFLQMNSSGAWVLRYFKLSNSSKGGKRSMTHIDQNVLMVDYKKHINDVITQFGKNSQYRY